jgi:renal tumor antigen
VLADKNLNMEFEESILMNKYQVLGKQGVGTFSEVLKCRSLSDGSLWACKKLKKRYQSLEQVNNLREIQAMQRLAPHPNILQLHEILFDTRSGTLVLVSELMNMNIYEFIRGRKQWLPESVVKNYMYQLCKSIDHMHRRGIFHRDVKPENILIKDDRLKLADFGSCRSRNSKPPYTEYISTRWYRSPECLLTDGFYSHKMDVWSMGCVFYEIISLHPLFPGTSEVDQISRIHNVLGTPDDNVLNKFKNKTRTISFNFPKKSGTGIDRLIPHASSDSIDLMYKMCTYDPDDRISAHQALKHVYFADLRRVERRMAQSSTAVAQSHLTSSTTSQPPDTKGTSIGRKHAHAVQQSPPPSQVLPAPPNDSRQGCTDRGPEADQPERPGSNCTGTDSSAAVGNTHGNVLATKSDDAADSGEKVASEDSSLSVKYSPTARRQGLHHARLNHVTTVFPFPEVYTKTRPRRQQQQQRVTAATMVLPPSGVGTTLRFRLSTRTLPPLHTNAAATVVCVSDDDVGDDDDVHDDDVTTMTTTRRLHHPSPLYLASFRLHKPPPPAPLPVVGHVTRITGLKMKDPTRRTYPLPSTERKL